MKNNITIIISFLLLLTMFSCDNKVNTLNTNTQNKAKVDFDPLKERNSQLAQAADWADIKSKATELKNKIDLNPNSSSLNYTSKKRGLQANTHIIILH